MTQWAVVHVLFAPFMLPLSPTVLLLTAQATVKKKKESQNKLPTSFKRMVWTLMQLSLFFFKCGSLALYSIWTKKYAES